MPKRYAHLLERYKLAALSSRLSQHSLLLNLSKLDQLESSLEKAEVRFSGAPLRVLDVGSQHFVYAPAMQLFFANYSTQRARQVETTGIEVDAYRRYLSLHTRRNLARYYASLVSWTDYQVGDFVSFPFEKRFSVITMFRPHIAPEPLLQAGLPLNFLAPERIFERAFQLLDTEGKLILSYQSEAEMEEGDELLRKLGKKPLSTGRWDPIEGSVEKRPQWFEVVC